MSRRPARFTEADVRRAAKVAKQLGMAVEIKPAQRLNDVS